MKARTWFEAQGRRMRSRSYTWPQAKVAIGLYGLPKWAQQAFARGHLLQSPPPKVSEAAIDRAWDRFTSKLAALRERTAGVLAPIPHTFAPPDADTDDSMEGGKNG